MPHGNTGEHRGIHHVPTLELPARAGVHFVFRVPMALMKIQTLVLFTWLRAEAASRSASSLAFAASSSRFRVAADCSLRCRNLDCDTPCAFVE